MGFSGKDTQFAAVIESSATAWGTATAVGAGSMIKLNKTGPPIALPEYKIRETTDSAWMEKVDQGDVKGVSYTLECPLVYNNTTGTDPVTGLLLSLLTAGDLSTQQGVTAAYLHTQTITSGRSLADTVSRFATLAWRMKLIGAGYAYAELPSWQPFSFELSSKGGGTDPVMLKIEGIADRAVTDLNTVPAVNTATPWGNVTDLSLPQVHHRHIGATGCWWAKSAAVGGSPVTFDATTVINPSAITIKMNRKFEGKQTTTMYIDQPYDNDFVDLTVELEFNKMADTWWTNFIDNQKHFEESGVEAAYHFRPRWTYPTAIATTYYPYWEIGLPRLICMDTPELLADAGKVMPYKLKLVGARPSATSHLPVNFLYAGGAAGAARDAMYVAVMDAKVAAYIA